MTIVSHLSRYWRQHPDACDTAEGIARWWIDVEPQPVPATLVEGALGWMSACGVVEALQAADGRVRYRRVSTDAALGARLDALVDNPQSVLPTGKPRVH
ncbi:hypothetical protein ACG02S_05400 [Roseateles sp. DC23W]|uniref:Uncharacterized protein n=2 Tax=Pelomonas dachongensis TaxID=3299029 RepID=A0ABW7EM16_9BURK